MASSYPGGLDSFVTTRTNSTVNNPAQADDHNNYADAINKIEAELGINPSGADYSTVTAFLLALAAPPLATKTTSYTLVATDSVILADATSSSLAMTLPTAVGRTGKQYRIKRISTNANTVTVGTTSSQTIDGVTSYLLTANECITVVSDGANWRII